MAKTPEQNGIASGSNNPGSSFQDFMSSVETRGTRLIDEIIPKRMHDISIFLLSVSQEVCNSVGSENTNLDAVQETQTPAKPKVVKKKATVKNGSAAQKTKNPTFRQENDKRGQAKASKVKAKPKVVTKKAAIKNKTKEKKVVKGNKTKGKDKAIGKNNAKGNKKPIADNKVKGQVKSVELKKTSGKEEVIDDQLVNKKIHFMMVQVRCFLEQAADDIDDIRLFLTKLERAEPTISETTSEVLEEVGEIKQYLAEVLLQLEEDIDDLEYEDRKTITEFDRRVMRYLRSTSQMLVRKYLGMKLDCDACRSLEEHHPRNVMFL